MPLVIPTSSQPPLTREPKTLVACGREKIGKSETVAKLAATPAGLLHVDTHQGTGHIATRRVLVNSRAEWEELCAALPGAWKASPFRFLAIDVLDDVEQWALEVAEERFRRMPVGKNFGGVSILELDRGLGYGYLRDDFFKLIAPVWGNAMWTTLFIVHSRPKWVDATAGIAEANSDQLDLTGKVRKLMCNRVDAVGQFYQDLQGRLRLSFKTKDQVGCGLRARYLHGKEILFSDPAKAEEWAAVWPETWNRAPEPLPAPVASAPAPKPSVAPVTPPKPPATPVAAPAPAPVSTPPQTPTPAPAKP